MTEDLKNFGQFVGILIVFCFFIGLFMLPVFLIVKSIRNRRRGLSGKDELSEKSSAGHDRSQPLPPEYTQFQ